MTWLVFAALAVVLIGAVPTTVWLKRAGDRAWEEHQRRARQAELLRPIGEAFLRFQIDVADRMTPVLRKLGVELTEWQRQVVNSMYDESGRPRFDLARALETPRRKGPTL